MTDTLPLVSTHNLSFRFGKRQVLPTVNLAVPPAGIYGFLGLNGAVRLFGHDLARHRWALLGRVGALIEMPSPYECLSGQENLEVTRRLRGGVARTPEALATLQLSAEARRPVREYSLGLRNDDQKAGDGSNGQAGH